MRFISTLATLATLAQADICHTAEISLYSTVTHKTAYIKSNITFDIVDHNSHLVINRKLFRHYRTANGITSYIRGKTLIFKEGKGINKHYYIRKVDQEYTTQLICKGAK